MIDRDGGGDYRQVVDSCPDAILVHASDRLLFANPAAARLLGVPDTDALAGIRLSDLIITGDAALPFESGHPAPGDSDGLHRWRLRRLDGTIVDVTVSAAPVRFGGRSAIQVVARAAPPEPLSTEQQGPGEAHLRGLVENAAEAMILCDEKGRVIEWNRGAEEVTGVRAEDAIGSSLRATWHQFVDVDAAAPEERARVNAEHGHELQAGNAPWLSRVSVSTIRRADGSTRIIEHRPFSLQTDRGPWVGAAILDVTDRERSVAALRASEETLREFVRRADDAIVLTDERGNIAAWNDAAAAESGIPPGDVLGQPYWDVDSRLVLAESHTNERREAVREGVIQALATGEAPWLDRPLQSHFRRADGTSRHAVRRVFLVPTAKGRLLASISHDVTEQRRTLVLLEIQRDLAIDLAAATDAAGAMRLTLDAAMRIEDVDGGGIYAVDPASGALELLANAGLSEAFVAAVSRFPADASETRTVMTGQVIDSADYPDSEAMQEMLRREGLHAMLAVPVVSDGRVIAVLNVASRVLDEMNVGVRSAGEAIASQLGGALARIGAEASLRESEERYRTLVEEMSEGAAIISAEATFVLANHAAESILGVEPGTLAGRSLADFVSAETMATIGADPQLQGLRRAGAREVEIVRADGHTRRLVVTTTPRGDGNGAFVGALTVFADVTEQRRAEEALRRRAEFDRLLATTFTHFATSAAQDVDQRVNEVMGTVAAFVGVDHALVFGLSPERSTWGVTHEWCAEGIAPRGSADRRLPIGTLAWSEDRLLNDEVVRLETADDYPPEAGADRSYLRDEGAISACLVPMRSTAGTVVGAIGLHSHAHRIAWSDDDVLRLRMIGDAIAGFTDRVRAETGLRRSEERFSKVFRSSPAPISISRLPDGLLLDVNDAIVSMFGYTRDESVGRTVSDLGIWVNPDERSLMIERLRQDGRVQGQRTMFRHRSGEVLATLLSAETVDLAGESCLLTLLVDITGLEKAEADRARLVAAIEQSADAVVVADAGGSVVYANRAYERIFGRARADVLGKPVASITGRSAVPEGAAAQSGALGRWIREIDDPGESNVVHTEWVVAPMVDTMRESIGQVAIARDRTAERALQERLSQAQKLEAVGLLAGGIAHDFNNLITAIRGYAELVGRQLREEDQGYRDTEQILRACDRAAGLVDQLATFSRRAPHRPRVLDPAAVIDGVTPMLRRLLGGHIDLVVRHGPHVGRIRADPGQLEQVIVNLAINARDAMPEGGRLEIGTDEVELPHGSPLLTASMTPGSHVSLSVSDSGVGMDEATLGRMFEPFFTTKERGRGSGMGLAIVFGIVEQSRGSIAVDSAPGRGTKFSVLLPRAPELPATEGISIADGAEAAPRPRGSGTVLLVEVDQAVRRFVERALRDEGYEVLAVASGDEALRVAVDHPEWGGILMTDVIMPGLSGPDLADRLGSLHTDLRVLFVSGHAGEATARLALDRTDRALLLKPFGVDALVRHVSRLIVMQPGTGR